VICIGLVSSVRNSHSLKNQSRGLAAASPRYAWFMPRLAQRLMAPLLADKGLNWWQGARFR
jgi:hypothetical protein